MRALVKHLCPLAVVLAVGLAAANAHALHPHIVAAKDAFQKGDFRDVLQRLEAAERAPELTEDELAEVHWYRGLALVAMTKEAEAEKSFDKVLGVRPLYEPNKLETPPNVRAMFERRAVEWRRHHGVIIHPSGFRGASVEVLLTGHVTDVGDVQIFARPQGELSYRRFTAPVKGTRASVKLDDKQLWERLSASKRLELVVEARRASGTPVARAGDALAPVALDVAAQVATLALKEFAPPPAPATPVPSPVAAPTPSAAPRAAPQEPAPQKIIVLRPKEPAAPPPAPRTDPSPPPAAAPITVPITRNAPPTPLEEETSGARTILQVLGGVLLVGSGVVVLVALGMFAASAAAWGSFGYTNQVLSAVGADFLQDRESWILAWQVSWIVGSILVPTGVLAALVALGGAGLGVAAFVRSMLM